MAANAEAQEGRGFAVVADEVSKLAERSARSVGEIDTLARHNVTRVNDGGSVSREQAGAGEIADAVDNLAPMATELRETVSRFEIAPTGVDN